MLKKYSTQREAFEDLWICVVIKHQQVRKQGRKLLVDICHKL